MLEEQRALPRLSVFVGGCTMQAAEAVCVGAGDAMDDIASLIDKSLLRSIPQTEERQRGATPRDAGDDP